MQSHLIARAWLQGWHRVLAAPLLVAGLFAVTLLTALPLAVTVGEDIRTHLGGRLAADAVAEEIDYDWWQEFSASANGPSAAFTPAVLGFAATLGNISGVLDAESPELSVAMALAVYLAAWTFLSGGLIDRYARERRVSRAAFFAACGVFFFRFLRLSIAAGIFYWWAFAAVHPLLLSVTYAGLARDIADERGVLAIRMALYLAFGAVLFLGNVIFDYAKIRAVVEDRRSMLGALGAAIRFVARHPGRSIGLYAVNGATFVALVALWAFVAPGAWGDGLAMWVGLLVGQAWVAARLVLKLHVIASQTALFQESLAHARYAAAPLHVRPPSPDAERLGAR